MVTGDSGCEAYTAIAWGMGLSHEGSDVAGAEGFYSLEGNMCGTVIRGADALPGSKATSNAKGSHRKLGGLVSGRQRCVRGTVRIGKVRSPMNGYEKSDPAIVAEAMPRLALHSTCRLADYAERAGFPQIYGELFVIGSA